MADYRQHPMPHRQRNGNSQDQRPFSQHDWRTVPIQQDSAFDSLRQALSNVMPEGQMISLNVPQATAIDWGSLAKAAPYKAAFHPAHAKATDLGGQAMTIDWGSLAKAAPHKAAPYAAQAKAAPYVAQVKAASSPAQAKAAGQGSQAKATSSPAQTKDAPRPDQGGGSSQKPPPDQGGGGSPQKPPPNNENGKNAKKKEKKEGKKKEKEKASTLWRVFFIIALLVFVSSLVALGVIGFGYLSGRNVYRDVANIGFAPPQDSEGITDTGLSLADLTVDWDALLEKNPDTVAWVYIPGTVVNYPIVHTTNNEKYLTVDFLGGRGRVVTFGAIFLDARNRGDFSDPNSFLYGHHMNDGSMFACVDTFRNAEEFDSHRTIYILTPTANYRLTTFSLVICDGNDPLAQPTFSDSEEMREYFQDKINRSVVTPGWPTIEAKDISKCFVLVTCDYTINDGRAALFASVVETAILNTSSGQQKSSEVNPDDANAIGDAAAAL